MRIAVVHSFYRQGQPSGENVAVEAEASALDKAGHDVHLIRADTDLETGLLFALRAGVRTLTGRGRSPLRAIERINPDIVHVHNLFPNFGRAWLTQLTTPLVVTLHNYRPICANGLLLRDNAHCELCPNGARWSGVRYRCYRNSRLMTFPISWANRNGPLANPLLTKASQIVFLSTRQRVLYHRAGLVGKRERVIGSFLPDALDPGGTSTERSDSLVVGRLDVAKGVLDLIRQWPQTRKLTIIGTGPLRSEVERFAASSPNVNYLGNLRRKDVIEAMQRHRVIVFPSLAFEAAPLVYVEGLASGCAFIARSGGAIGDAVAEDGTGAVFGPESLEQALTQLETMNVEPDHCRNVFEAKYTEAHHVRDLVSLYAEIISADNSIRR